MSTQASGQQTQSGAADPAVSLLADPPKGTEAGVKPTSEAPKDGNNTAAGGAGEPEKKDEKQAAQGDGTKKAEGDGEKAKPQPIEVKLPDGVEADPELIGALKDTVKDQASAQKLVESLVKSQQRAEAKALEAAKAEHDGWVKSVKEDKEFGGKALEQTLADAKKAIAKFGDKDLADKLKTSAIGSWPPLLKLLARIGKATAEDTIAGTSGTTGGSDDPQATLNRKLYPTMFSES